MTGSSDSPGAVIEMTDPKQGWGTNDWAKLKLLILQLGRIVAVTFKIATSKNMKLQHTAISRPVGYEVYKLPSNMPTSQKKCKPLQAKN